MSAKPLTCIDLFCGCGGFSLGMSRAGFRVLAAIDFNEHAVQTFKANFPKETLALCKDLTKFTPDKLATEIGNNHVDVIVGGPPCQGFSTVRQVDASNHGSRVKRDKRRYLYKYFLDYVAAFRPSVFIMENVLGLQSAAKGKFFTLIQGDARKLGYRVQSQVEESWKLGVPQKRRRQLVIGVRNDIPGFFSGELVPSSRINSCCEVRLWDAIGDLPPLRAGEGQESRAYDMELRKAFLAIRGAQSEQYLNKVLEVDIADTLTCHRARPHSERDLRDFARLREGETGDQAISRGVQMEYPYDRQVFLDRYRRQHRENLCSTIVAHLAKDGLMFIHPTQCRTLTPREAARIQSFPDWFQFPVARTHQFRLIGNAVPPLVAEAIAEELTSFLGTVDGEVEKPIVFLHSIPRDEKQATEWLRPLMELSPRALRQLDDDSFQRGWHAIAFLFAGLHPDGALDHGDHICRTCEDASLSTSEFDRRLLAPYYERSGWPVILAPIAREAWRRFRDARMEERTFYCAEAQSAGIRFRNPQLHLSTGGRDVNVPAHEVET